jgi:hypothetical protein
MPLWLAIVGLGIGIAIAVAIGFFGRGMAIGTAIATPIPIPTPKFLGFCCYFQGSSSRAYGAPARMKIGFADATMVNEWCNWYFRDAIFKAAPHAPWSTL